MTEAYVVDTHALIWLLGDPGRLGGGARAVLELAMDGKVSVAVPTIAFVEMQYKEDKGVAEFPAGCTERAKRFVEGADGFAVATLDMGVVDALARVPRRAVPDMPDRIVAATALARGASLLTVDGVITAWSGVPIVW